MRGSFGFRSLYRNSRDCLSLLHLAGMGVEALNEYNIFAWSHQAISNKLLALRFAGCHGRAKVKQPRNEMERNKQQEPERLRRCWHGWTDLGTKTASTVSGPRRGKSPQKVQAVRETNCTVVCVVPFLCLSGVSRALDSLSGWGAGPPAARRNLKWKPPSKPLSSKATSCVPSALIWWQAPTQAQPVEGGGK
ncbi:hypothetical protein B0H66DRAFT_348926 [Apodospora peruviana]|uniref:Uncharacterized protein n=1 Tax=Apodospora peruviana TaxID=516989 RepID=A0AAE0HVI2_9PEZI|nr:hypothetical protein B0H66DRAFT_348926 [Apodospora peruviana]